MLLLFAFSPLVKQGKKRLELQREKLLLLVVGSHGYYSFRERNKGERPKVSPPFFTAQVIFAGQKNKTNPARVETTPAITQLWFLLPEGKKRKGVNLTAMRERRRRRGCCRFTLPCPDPSLLLLFLLLFVACLLRKAEGGLQGRKGAYYSSS